MYICGCSTAVIQKDKGGDWNMTHEQAKLEHSDSDLRQDTTRYKQMAFITI